MSKARRDYILFLEDIIGAISNIEQYTKGMDLETLKKNRMAVDAVIRNFEIIGEAVKHVPDSLKKQYTEVEWKEAAGFRDILIHDYFGIDISAVYDTIKNNLPEFRRHIKQVLTSERKKEKL
jgi:uncharacterized protein with HEPN domain